MTVHKPSLPADRGTAPQPLGPKAGRPLTPPRLELGRRDQGPIAAGREGNEYLDTGGSFMPQRRSDES